MLGNVNAFIFTLCNRRNELLFILDVLCVLAVPEPPSLWVSPCNDFLCVYLQSPSERLNTVYKNFRYTLHVTNERGVQVGSVISYLIFARLSLVRELARELRWYCILLLCQDLQTSDCVTADPVCIMLTGRSIIKHYSHGYNYFCNGGEFYK